MFYKDTSGVSVRLASRQTARTRDLPMLPTYVDVVLETWYSPLWVMMNAVKNSSFPLLPYYLTIDCQEAVTVEKVVGVLLKPPLDARYSLAALRKLGLERSFDVLVL